MSKNIDEWDLSALFKSIKEMDSFVASLKKRAESFEKKHNGKVSKIADINSVMREYEGICEGMARIATYSFLLFAKDTKKGAIYAKYELLINEIQNHIIFFEVEFAKIDDKIAKNLIAKSTRYKYYLSKIFAQKKHSLSKEEEKIILKLSPVGANAFSRLFDEHLSKMRFILGDKAIN